MAAGLTENAWEDKIRELAALYQWRLVFHMPAFKPKRRYPDAGWPDLVLCKPPRLVVVELKTDAASSKPTAKQIEWLLALEQCGVEVGLWRPRDLPEVIRTLGPRAQRPIAPSVKLAA